MDMTMASIWMRSACARTTGRAISEKSNVSFHFHTRRRARAENTSVVPMTRRGGSHSTGRAKNVPIPMITKNPVKKRPRSSTAAPELSTKSSGLAQRLQIQLGTGART